MTTAKLETIDREKGKLFLTDAELIRRSGVPAFGGQSRLPICLRRSLDARLEPAYVPVRGAIFCAAPGHQSCLLGGLDPKR